MAIPGWHAQNFNSNAVYEFDTAGTLIGPFGRGFNCDPELIVFDSAGDAYIGQADCSGDVLKFNAAGGLRDTYDVPIDDRGSDWIDLAADQCTLRYTSEGSRLLQYDVCTHQPLPDLATLGRGQRMSRTGATLKAAGACPSGRSRPSRRH